MAVVVCQRLFCFDFFSIFLTNNFYTPGCQRKRRMGGGSRGLVGIILERNGGAESLRYIGGEERQPQRAPHHTPLAPLLNMKRKAQAADRKQTLLSPRNKQKVTFFLPTSKCARRGLARAQKKKKTKSGGNNQKNEKKKKEEL